MRKSGLGLIMMLLFAMFTNCSNKTSMVQADANNDADFDNFKSYAFASQVDNKLDEGLYFLNDLVAKSMIRDAVSHELGSRGYENSAQGADMVVNFRVFDKATSINSLQDMGTDYWYGTTLSEAANQRTVEVQPGTLMLHVVNKESGEVLWQGFASGIMDGNTITHDKTKIQQAVSSLFDQFVEDSNNTGIQNR